MEKVGVLSIQGLPARHGAFEQTVDRLVNHSLKNHKDLKFYVGCSLDHRDLSYPLENVNRIFSSRFKGIGVIIYGLINFIKLYILGVRKYFVFGYGISPLFFIFSLMNCKIICNVDGFEWRRKKWSKLAKSYFKFCELCAVKSNAILIFDSIAVARYYNLIHKRNGVTLFYGCEKGDISSVSSVDMKSLSNLPDKYFIVVMRMEPENHILEIVKARVKATKCTIDLILIGPSTPFFEKNVLPILYQNQDKIKWLGPIYDRNLLMLYRKNALAYIHGHSVGGTNPTLVEACYIQKPIIAYSSMFNREVLGSKGYYFSSVDSLANHLESNKFNILPPQLDFRYSWDFVCNGYLEQL